MTEEQRTNSSPIAKLPPELLAAVFDWVATLDPIIPLPADGQPLSLAWVRLTHVCSIWRQIALREHSLWAGAIGGLGRASKEFLARAGDHALLSFFYVNSPQRKDFLALERQILIDQLRAPERAGRVGSIGWYSDVEHRDISSEVEALNGILGGNKFEALEWLRVEISSPGVDRAVDGQGSLYARSLQIAYLNGYFIPIVAPQLTDLVLKSLGGWISADEILQVLRNCPLLTSIEIDGFHGGCRALEERDAPVRLAHLERLVLRLEIHARKIAAFIEHLSMPATVTLRVRNHGSFDSGCYGLLSTMFATAGAVDEPIALEINETLIRLTVVSSSRVKLVLRCSDLNLAHALPILDLSRYLRRVVHLTTAPSPIYSSTADWTRVFHHFPAVSRLELNRPNNRGRPSMRSIFAALGSGPQCPLPELARMVVCSAVAPTQLKANDVLGCLNARKAAGARPLASLDLQCCQKHVYAARLLEELVEGDVRWKDS